MLDISKEMVLCDGMVMSRKDAIEYMRGRLIDAVKVTA